MSPDHSTSKVATVPESREALPATAAQSEIWVGQQLHGDSPVYNLSLVVEIAGPVDLERVAASIRATVDRAEALHVRFTNDENNKLVQVPTSTGAWELTVLDLRAEEDPEAAARAWMSRDMLAVVGLDAQEPLFGQALLRTGDEQVYWFQRYHHSVMDGYGISLLVADAVERYESEDGAGSAGTWSLARFVELDRAYRESSRYDDDRRFWLAQALDGAEPPRLLPPATGAGLPSGVTVEISGIDADRLYEFAAAAGVRRTRLPIAALVAYIHRITGQRDLTVSLPMTARVGREMRTIPGMTSTILPLRIRVDPTLAVAELATKLDTVLVSALRHGRYRGEDLARDVREVDPDRQVFGPGINSMMFEHALSIGDATTSVHSSATGPVDDLDFTIRGGQDGVPIRIDMRAPYGLERELGEHKRRLEHFLAQFISRPTAAIGSLDPLTDAERRRILEEFNDTRAPQRSATVPGLFAAIAAATPDAEALIAGDTRLTYRELRDRVAQLAQVFVERGLGPEDVVAIGVPRSPEMVVGILAAMAAGGAFVPLDPSWPEDRRNAVLVESGAALVLSGPGGVDAGERTVFADLDNWAYSDRSTALPSVLVQGSRLAYMIFTSGSTGRPKGAMIRHEAVCARLLWQRDEILGFGPEDASLFKAPLAFDISVNEILLPLISGGRLIVAEPDGERDAQYLLDLIARERVTFVYLVSSMLDVLLGLARGTDALQGLKHVWCGGEVLTPGLFERFRSQLSTTLYHGYGPAEATIGVSHVIYRDDAERIATSIGKPNPNTQLYVLDANLQPVPVGQGGELYAAGFLLGRGYTSAPGLTASRFVANPFGEPGSRIYRTGDLARWAPDGTLDFLGRTDNQVKIRGMRLELEDVEAGLGSHPDVRRSAVVVRRAPQGAKYLAGYVVSEDACELTVESLRTWARAKLPEYMVPTAFVVMDDFPLTPNGKVDRRALPEPDLTNRGDNVAPRSSDEAVVCGLMADVLGLESVGVTDDFFALGGDSIVAIQLVNHARSKGVSITPREVFALRTAEAIARAQVDRAEAMVDVDDVFAGETEPTPIMSRLQETANDAVAGFHQSVLLRVPADFTVEVARTALAALVERHDALRARLVRGDRWTLDVPQAGPGHPDLVHEVTVDTVDGATIRKVRTAAVDRLDPDNAVMVQAILVRSAEGTARLLVVGHHLVVDGVSWRVIVEDVARAGISAMTGENSEIAPVGTSFRRWTQRVAERARAGAFDDELEHWREVAATATPRLGSRALDPERDTTATAEALELELPPELCAPLLSTVPAAFHGHVNDVLLTALAIAMKRWLGGDGPVLVDLEGHGREEDLGRSEGTAAVDLSRTVGWFTTVYPVSVHPGDTAAASPRDLAGAVKAVKEQLRRTPNAGFGYGALRFLGSHDELAVTPQVLFNYLGRVAGNDGADWLPVEMTGAGDPNMPLGHPMAIDVIAVEGEDGVGLRTTISWAGGVLESEAIHDFGREWTSALTDLARSAEFGGHTPSDFELVGVTQQDLDSFDSGVVDILPLTPLQEGIYFQSVFETDRSDPYVVQQIIELTGSVDADALRSGVQAVVDRHAALRTGLKTLSDGSVVQAVYGAARVPFDVTDLSSSDDTTADIRQILGAERQRGFDFAQPPLLRYTLARVDEQKFILLQSVHHVVADGWSVPVMLRELMAHYGTATGESPLLSATPYRSYLEWLSSRDRAASHAAWQMALEDAPEQPELPGSGSAESETGSVRVNLSQTDTNSLSAGARVRGLTLSTVVHGTWGLLLGRIAGVEDVIFGSTVSGRGADLPGIEGMVGLFINTVPARIRFSAAEKVSEVLTRWQDEQSALLDHQYLGLPELRRVTGLADLFETLVVFENYPIGDGGIADPSGTVHITGIEFDENPAYPLTLIVAPGECLALDLKYDASRVDSATASLVADGMVAYLAALAADMDTAVSQVSLARQALPAPVTKADEETAAATVTTLLEMQVGRTPDRPAVKFGDEQLDYAQLHRESNRLAHLLIERGVTPESIVGIALPRSVELIVAIVAVLKAGGAYLPLDTGYPADRLAYMLDDASPVCVLTDGVVTLPDTDVPLVTVDHAVLQSHSTEPVDVEIRPGHPAYVIYTSGSTGRPKGVVVPHEGVVNRLSWMQKVRPLGTADRVLQKTPSSFDVSVPEFFGPLIAGATLVVAKPDGHKDPEYLSDLIRREAVTRTHFVPSMLEAFLGEPTAPQCTSLQVIHCSGEALPVHVARRVAEVLPDVEVENLYGPTEASVEVTRHESAQRVPADAPSVPIGKAAHATGLYVLDRYLQPVPQGLPGELYLAGTQLARGYLRRPAVTSDRFVADPFGADGARMYRSGDLVRWNDNDELEYLGRSDFQVKLRGFRIELGEIEAQLARCPGVKQAAALVRTDRPGQQQLVGYLVGNPDLEDVRVRLFASLPEFMVPVAFVVLDDMPLSPSGKLDRGALPAPEVATGSGAPILATAVDGAGAVLARRYAEILGVESVGADDDFFALGGDSILAIRLVNLARKDGITVTPRQIFEQRTPAALARLVGDVPVAAAVPAEPPVGELLPLPVVHRLSEWSGGKDRFNQAVLVRTPAITHEAISAAIAAVVAHHDGLRQRLTRHGQGMWSLAIDEHVDVPVRRVETAGLSGSDLRDLIETESNAATDRLDPDAGTMLTAVWFDAGAGQPGRLLVVAHHLVVDGVSWRILLEDLAMAAVAAANGEAAALDPVGTSLRSYSRIVALEAQRASRLTELELWTRTTEPGAELIPGTSGHASVGSGSRRTVTVDSATTAAMLTAIPAMANADVTDVLLTALRLSVTEWFAEKGRRGDLLVDLERHGREELEPGVDLSRTIGWFTSVSPVRLESASDPVAALKSVKDQLRRAPDGGIGYGMLRYANARTAVASSGRAESQVLFNYLGRTPVGGDGPWTTAPESDSLATDPDADLGGPYRLVINAVCEDGSAGSRLRAVFAWADDLEESDAVALSEGWVEALQELARTATEHAGQALLTPSDVSLTGLTQPDIDRIVQESPSGVDTILPLSPLQEGLYFQANLDAGKDIYTAQFSLDFGHRLDVDRLHAALRTLTRRNPMLRAGFVSDGLPEPAQFIGAGLDVPVVEHDLRDLDDAAREARAVELSAEDRATPFDLTAPPLWRAMLLRLTDEHDRLVINRQFLLWDGWSNGLVVSALLALYESGGDDRGYPAPEGTFEDYLQWLAAQDQGAAEKAWSEALRGLDEPTLLASPVQGPPQLPRRQDTVLAADLSERLRSAAREAGVTFNAVLNAALALTIATATGRQDIVFGTTVAGRPPEVPGIDAVAGMFLNTVPVRVTLRPDESAAELMRRTQADRLSLGQYDYLGLAAIQRVSQHRKLFDVLYVLQNFVDENQVSALNAAHDISDGDSVDHTHYPLTVVVTPGTSVRIKFEFHPEVIEAQRVESMLEQFVGLLEQWAQSTAGLVARTDLPTLPDTGRNDHPLPESTIADLFGDVALLQPDETALVFGDRVVTYAELDADINRMARLLLNRGAGPEKIVALGLPRTIDMVVALFAVLRSGAAYLPLELDHPAERLAGMLDDASPVLLLTTAQTADKLGHVDVDTVRLDLEDWRSLPESQLSPEELGAFAPGSPGRLEHPAYVIYTSGSTGKPKGVVTAYRGLTNMQFNHREAIFEPVIRDAGDRRLRIAHTVSFAFDMSWEELLWLVEGHEVHICDENLRRDAEALVSYCHDHAIDVVNVTPTYAQHLLEEGLLDDRDGAHRPPLVLLGGEAVPESVWNRLRDTEGTCGYNLYGPTEYTINTLGAGTDDSATPTVGKPIWNTRAYVLDSWLRPVPDGVPGELYISGIGLARGYLNRPGLSAERFVADPFEPSVRMYRTGDLVRRRDDRSFDFLGRTDDQVKIRGHRIELGEVTSVLESLADVKQAAVIADDGPGGFKRLIAYLVPVSGSRVPGLVNRSQALRALLPDYMVPAAMVEVDSLPLTVNGKLDVKALPPASSVLGAEDTDRVEPATPVEEALADLFADVLDIPVPGVTDNFFDLGGHSLLATKLISRARTVLSAELAMRDLFETPTVRELAARISESSASTRPTLVAGPRPERIPLSPAQRRLWLIQQMEGSSAAYNFPIVFRTGVALDAAVFTEALADVVARHESLRTVFVDRDGEPVQVILDDVCPQVTTTTTDEDGIEQAVRDALSKPFDLSTDIPVRATVIDVVGGEQILAIVLHHIATDEWSDRPFTRDLMTAYAARAQGKAPEHAPLSVQYADYTLWQRSLLGDPEEEGSVAHAQLDYWARVLDGAPDELVLPTDRSRPARPTFTGGAVTSVLSGETTAALRGLARASGASMFMVLHAASAALLHRLGAGEDLPLGAPVAGRAEEGLDDLVGFFVNTVVLRTDLSGDPTFRELVGRVREGDLAAFSQADIPFESVVEKVNPPRTLSRNPLFQVMVGYHSRQEGSAGSFTPLSVDEHTAKFDLVFNFTEYVAADGGPGRVELRLEYGSDLFDRATVEAISARQSLLLDAVAANADTRVGGVETFLSEERELVLTGFNDTDIEVPEETFHQAFTRNALATPDAIAVVDARGEVTYAELSDRADRIAAVLHDRGVCVEATVALAVPRSTDFVAAVLAVSRLGAAYLALDLNHPRERIDYMLDDSRAQVLLTTTATESRLAGVDGLIRVVLDDTSTVCELAANGGRELPPEPSGLAHAAYVIYTSGSTGKPKGAVLTHDGIPSLVATAEQRMALVRGSVVMQFASVGFDVAVFELSMALCTGSRLVIVPDDARTAGPELTDFMEHHGVTHAIIPPSLLAALPPGCLVPEGCTVLVGTETVPPELIGRWAERLNLLAAYGLTEATVNNTLWQAQPGWSEAVPIGIPDPNEQAYVLDARLQPVPPGVAGELYIAGRGLARGYLGRPDLTVSRFVANPFGPGRIYRTGDRARWRNDGNLDFLGRVDEQVKIRGFRIEPGEIVAALSSHESVNQAALVADREGGIVRLVAYVTPTQSHVVDPIAVREFVSDVLPDYMVPAIVIVLEGSLPLTPNGKLDRKALPPPNWSDLVGDGEPRTETERAIAAEFADILYLPGVGIHDDFFELGGHSMASMRLVARIREKFGVSIGIRDVFDAPTVARLAEIVDAGGDSDRPALLPTTRPETLPLSGPQLTQWNRLQTAGPTADHALALTLTDRVDPEALAHALDDVSSRHEPLRTVYVEVDGVVVAQEAVRPALELEDVGDGDLHRAVFDIAQRPMNPAEDAPLRVHLVSGSDGAQVVLVVMHYLAVDEWSVVPLLEDLFAAYGARVAGQEPEWVPLPVTYPDYVVHTEAVLGDPGDPDSVRSRQLDYWRVRLAGMPERLELPTPDVGEHRAEVVPIEIDADLHRDIDRRAQVTGTSMFMVLQAAFARMLSGSGVGEDIPIGALFAGRNDPRLEGLIGCFFDTTILRTEVRESTAELLASIRENNLRALEHQDVPFAEVVEALGGADALRPQVLMVHHQQAQFGDLGSLGSFWPVPTGVPFADFTLSFYEPVGDGPVPAHFTFATDVLAVDTVRSWARAFVDELRSLVNGEGE
ncbi:amino acid adenylation domain-containing protein [Rhodococcus sp. NPDC058521]|uniref:amino acid adenylation domain-containing protein n=1 Tax=Rhodococcus sp. NPDC058521 TaxID=3346536 RepID=UPI003657F585